MSNQKKKKNSTYNQPKPLPLIAPTQAKVSGMAYSASIMFVMILSMVMAISLGVAGITIDGDNLPDWYIYCSFLLPQVALLLVAVLYFAWLKRPVLQAVKEQKCHPKYYLVAVFLQVGLLSLGSLNDIFIGFLQRFGYEQSPIVLPDLGGFGLVATIFCIALLPALFEELFFRGILLKGLRSFGTMGSIFLCGALFSLYHQSPVQTVYQFICGAAFAFVVVRSGSIFPTMLAHFLNNTFIIVLAKCGVDTIPKGAYLPYVMITSLCLVGTLGYLFFFDTPKTEEKEKPKSKNELQRQQAETKSERIRFFVCALVGITVFLINWLSALSKGF